MTLTLESWYTLSDVAFATDQLVARFVPGHFNAEVVDPVVTIVIAHPEAPDASSDALSRFRDDFAVDMSVSPEAFQVWGEYDDEPITVCGKAVTYQRSPYSPADLLAVVDSLAKELEDRVIENIRLRKAANEIEAFVIELLRRAEAKKSLTTRTTAPNDAQIDVLVRILNRLQSA